MQGHSSASSSSTWVSEWLLSQRTQGPKFGDAAASYYQPNQQKQKPQPQQLGNAGTVFLAAPTPRRPSSSLVGFPSLFHDDVEDQDWDLHHPQHGKISSSNSSRIDLSRYPCSADDENVAAEDDDDDDDDSVSPSSSSSPLSSFFASSPSSSTTSPASTPSPPPKPGHVDAGRLTSADCTTNIPPFLPSFIIPPPSRKSRARRRLPSPSQRHTPSLDSIREED